MANDAEIHLIEQNAYIKLFNIIKEVYNMNYNDRLDMFRKAMNSHDFIGGYTFNDIVVTLSPVEIIYAYNEWKESPKFSVGDQVIIEQPPNYKLGYVTRIRDGILTVIFADGIHHIFTVDEVRKTGKNVKKIPELLTYLGSLT